MLGSHLRKGVYYANRKPLLLFLPPMHLPFRFGHPHQELFITNWYPACKHFHCVFEIRIQKDLPRAIDQGRGSGVKDIEASIKGKRFLVRFGECRKGGYDVCVTKKHEDIPDTELSWEWDGIVEYSKVPTGSVRGRGDAKLGL